MFVAPKISEKKAEDIFSIKKSWFFWLKKFHIRRKRALPEKWELLYLPFYLFHISVEKNIKGRRQSFSPRQDVTLTVDGLLGHAVLFAEDALEVRSEPETPVPTCEFAISSSYAADIALDQYKGVLLEHGLRTRSLSHAGGISEGKKIYYPFWVGYFKKKKGYDFKALDAVSGEIQGVRMRRVFIKALREIG